MLESSRMGVGVGGGGWGGGGESWQQVQKMKHITLG